MNSQIQALFSNRVERLYERLKEHLFSSKTSPFTRRLLIVPSPAMKSWLMQRLTNDFGVAAGSMVTYLEPAINWIRETLAIDKEEKYRPLPRMGRALKIETLLREAINQGDPLLFPVIRYLVGEKKEKMTKREEKRMVAFSDQLAALFLQYEKFGQEMLKGWLSSKGGWQEEVWRRVVGQIDEVPLKWKRAEIQIHLFGISFISKQQHQLFLRLSEVNPVFYYLPSPCQAFWSDILSDQEGLREGRRWKKRGMSNHRFLIDETLLFDRNGLLANWGKVGRRMAAQMEETLFQTDEDYEVLEPSSLLEAVQMDMLLMRHSKKQSLSFEKGEHPGFKAGDCILGRVSYSAQHSDLKDPALKGRVSSLEDESIQLHSAPSKMREVEILYHALLKIIERHHQDSVPIVPQDILVMAPDIMEYEPYIRALFGSSESQIDYQTMDLNLLAHHETVEGFFHLLSLPSSRWDTLSLLKLLEFPSFQRRQRFSHEEAAKIKKWIQDSSIRWGEDRLHREEILREAHGEGITQQGEVGTWKEGLDRLLLGMGMCLPGNEELKERLSHFPVCEIPTTEQELLGRWIFCFRQLRADLKPLTDGSRWNLKTWSEFLLGLLEKYFLSGEEDSQGLIDLIGEFSKLGKSEQAVFSFVSIKFHLEMQVEKKRAGYRETHLQSVKFCSMLPMRAVPAKVIALMGMGEGAFPREDTVHSFNQLPLSSKADYCPNSADFDRYLFLEILLSCRQYFLMTYSPTDYGEGKDLSPSLVITELLSDLDRSYLLGMDAPSKKIHIHHPLFSFHRSYFEPNSPLVSYSESHFRAAMAYYQLGKKRGHSFIASFRKTPPLAKEEVIDLKHLVQLAKDPVEFYLNRRLGIYLDKDEDRMIRTEEDLIIEAKARGLLNKKALRTPLNGVLQAAEHQGLIPSGPFKESILLRIAADFRDHSQSLVHWGVTPEAICDIVSSTTQDKVSIEEEKWKVPPLELEVNGKKVTVVGKLNDICPVGWIAFQKGDKNEIAKCWPSYLFFLVLKSHFKLPVDDKLLFLKSGKCKSPWFNAPLSHLSRYIEYYQYALESPSPLIPDWIPSFLDKDPSSLKRKINTSLVGSREHFYCDGVKWLSRGGALPDIESMLKGWRDTAEGLFGELYREWYPSRGGEE